MAYSSGVSEEDEELKALLAKKRAELEKALAAREQAEAAAREEELARDMILRTILTDEARERLARIKLARPEFARAIEDQLILLARSGQIREPITDEQLKAILKRLTGRRREGSIMFKRKGGI